MGDECYKFHSSCGDVLFYPSLNTVIVDQMRYKTDDLKFISMDAGRLVVGNRNQIIDIVSDEEKNLQRLVKYIRKDEDTEFEYQTSELVRLMNVHRHIRACTWKGITDKLLNLVSLGVCGLPPQVSHNDEPFWPLQVFLVRAGQGCGKLNTTGIAQMLGTREMLLNVTDSFATTRVIYSGLGQREVQSAHILNDGRHQVSKLGVLTDICDIPVHNVNIFFRNVYLGISSHLPVRPRLDVPEVTTNSQNKSNRFPSIPLSNEKILGVYRGTAPSLRDGFYSRSDSYVYVSHASSISQVLVDQLNLNQCSPSFNIPEGSVIITGTGRHKQMELCVGDIGAMTRQGIPITYTSKSQIDIDYLTEGIKMNPRSEALVFLIKNGHSHNTDEGLSTLGRRQLQESLGWLCRWIESKKFNTSVRLGILGPPSKITEDCMNLAQSTLSRLQPELMSQQDLSYLIQPRDISFLIAEDEFCFASLLMSGIPLDSLERMWWPCGSFVTLEWSRNGVRYPLFGCVSQIAPEDVTFDVWMNETLD